VVKSKPPAPVPHAVPVFDILPTLSNCAQPVEPPAPETTRFVVDALVPIVSAVVKLDVAVEFERSAPLLPIEKTVAVEEPMMNDVVAARASIDSMPVGDVVPIPILLALSMKREVVAERLVPGAEKYGMEPVAVAEPIEPCDTPDV